MASSALYGLQREEPYWMPEAELAIGRSQDTLGGFERDLNGI